MFQNFPDHRRLLEAGDHTHLAATGLTAAEVELQDPLQALRLYRTAVLNGRFKGGYITRNYGDPANGINAVQLELAQRSYMEEKSGEYLPDKARHIFATLQSVIAIEAAN